MTEPLVSLPLTQYNALVQLAKRNELRELELQKDVAKFFNESADMLSGIHLTSTNAHHFISSVRSVGKVFVQRLEAIPPSVEAPSV